MYEHIPVELKLQENWVCARNTRKVPLRVDNLLAASVDKTDTWGSFADAYANVEKGLCEHIGYVFDGSGIIGIDLDHSFEDGILNDNALDIIERCRSYTEISKSGEGIHILVRGKLPFTGSNNRNGVEVYSTKRFFILTGNVIGYENIIENQEAIDWLINTHFTQIRITSNMLYKPALYQRTVSLENKKLSFEYPKIYPGSRNCCLSSYAGKLRKQNYSFEKISEKVHKLNKNKCEPPLPLDEVDNIIRSIMKYNNLSLSEG